MATGATSQPVDPVRGVTERLLQYCRDRNWAGPDPYDALNSPILRNLPGAQNRPVRIAFTQLLKRSPINLRPFLRVPPGHNPKGIALFTSAGVRLHSMGLMTKSEIRKLADLLLSLKSHGQPWPCWGYNFDWQTRTYLVPKGTPNIICTTFAGQALLDAYDLLKDPDLLEIAQGAGRFVLEGLQRTGSDSEFCFSYTPLRKSLVHNASLLGAGLLARLHQHAPSESLSQPAHAACRYSIQRQHTDGSWPYGEDPKQEWIDSFHTGFNLVALEDVRQNLGGSAIEASIRRGYSYYLSNFFTPEGIPKYYHNGVYPIDVHASAQALITGARLAGMDSRTRQVIQPVLDWTIANMAQKNGSFAVQKHRWYTNRIPYIRWAQAWMLIGLATWQAQNSDPNSPPSLS